MNKSFATATVVNARLGCHPRKNTTNNGQEVSSFNVAYDSGYGKNIKTVWVSCTVYGTMAEICNRYLRKGSSISFTGALSVQEWTDKDYEIEKSKIHVRIDTIVFNGMERKTKEYSCITSGKADAEDGGRIDSDDIAAFDEYEKETVNPTPQKEPPPFKVPDMDF